MEWTEWTYKENTENRQEFSNMESERDRLLSVFRDTVELERRNRKPKNVIVFGMPGSGKSSFLNTAMTSLSDRRRWYERAQVGSFTDGRQSTLHLVRYTRDRYITDKTERGFCFPTFYDVAGLEDENSIKIQEIIRTVIFGRLGDGQSLRDLRGFVDSCEENRHRIRQQYSKNTVKGKVDRIIFVASARSEIPLPYHLIEAILEVAHSNEIVIPIFGVLTHCDLVDFDDICFIRKEAEFKEILGLPTNRYLRCQNYCDDFDMIYGTNRTETAIPEIDIPVIKFMIQVCFPNLVKPSTRAVYCRPTEDDDPCSASCIADVIIICMIVFFAVGALSLLASVSRR